MSAPARHVLAALLLLAVTGGVCGVFFPACRRVTGYRVSPAESATRRRGEALSVLFGVVALSAAVHFLVAFFVVRDCELAVVDDAAPRPSRLAVPDRLRIASFNVLHGYPRFRNQEERFERTVRALRSLDADVLVLQEAWRTRDHGSLSERVARALGMTVVYARANGSKRFLGFEEGSAILSRYPILRARRLVLGARRSAWERRIAIVATIAVPGAAPLTVAGTHFSYGDRRVAAEQARELKSRLGDATILAGDFNARSESDAIRAFTSARWRDLVPGGIDHILVRKATLIDWRIASSDRTFEPDDLRRILGEDARISDHPAYVVDLVRVPALSMAARR